MRSQILNSPERVKLVSSLDRNSEDSYESTALASTADTSQQSSVDCIGPSDKRPVLAQHAEQGALVRPRTFYLAADSLPEPGECSVGKEPVGELSLSGEPECLSLPIVYFITTGENLKCRQEPTSQIRTRIPPNSLKGTGLLLDLLKQTDESFFLYS